MKPTCENCEHFDPTNDPFGTCRFSPPVSTGEYFQQPVIHKDRRACGQFGVREADGPRGDSPLDEKVDWLVFTPWGYVKISNEKGTWRFRLPSGWTVVGSEFGDGRVHAGMEFDEILPDSSDDRNRTCGNCEFYLTTYDECLKKKRLFVGQNCPRHEFMQKA